MSQADPAARHTPVMPKEVLAGLDVRPGMTVVDGTVGLGGHAALLADAAGPGGRLIGLDRDPDALALAQGRLADAPADVTLVHARFSDLPHVLADLSVPAADRVLLDIGVSSLQFDRAERGFSFRHDAPLDMRMDPSESQTAADIVQTFPEEELARVFRQYGEERFAGRIAKRIADERRRGPITTTAELAGLVERAVPRRGRIHPATRVFQALRIVVNDELGEIEKGLPAAFGALPPTGRLAVIAFHSLEDRIVKTAFRAWAAEGEATLLPRKCIKPAREECLANPRSRSARLRVLERI
jgi:16S rRNA (cytosine1402-N4)-methyltransferase